MTNDEIAAAQEFAVSWRKNARNAMEIVVADTIEALCDEVEILRDENNKLRTIAFDVQHGF